MNFYVVIFQNREVRVVPEMWIQHKQKKSTKIFLSQNENQIPDFTLPVKYFIQEKDSCYNGFVLGAKQGKFNCNSSSICETIVVRQILFKSWTFSKFEKLFNCIQWLNIQYYLHLIFKSIECLSIVLPLFSRIHWFLHWIHVHFLWKTCSL